MVKDATKVRLLTGAGLIDAKVVQVDAANDLALLKADGKFSSLPISSSRSAQLGGTVRRLVFPVQDFMRKPGSQEKEFIHGFLDSLFDSSPRRIIFKSARSLQTATMQPGKWPDEHRPLVDERGNVIGIVSAKLDASTALAMSGSLPENVNYAVKSSLLLSFLESVPDVDAKLKAPNTADEKFEDVVKSAQGAAVLVLVY